MSWRWPRALGSGRAAEGKLVSMDPQIDEQFVEWLVTPERLDELLAGGWRHFGPVFFRYSTMEWNGALVHVQPLRVVIEQACLSKSQRRVLRRNADLKLSVRPTKIDDERRRLFEAHRRRFTEKAPEALEEYLGAQPAVCPCENVEMGLFQGERLLAASFLDVGRCAASSVYAIFDPGEGRRSLGTCTMLWEIQYARERGCRYYYLGYAFHESSKLDYKKRFKGAEWYDWQGHWRPLVRPERA